MKVYCQNVRCRHCFSDIEDNDKLVCQADPCFITIPTARVFVLKCNTYLKRGPEEPLRPIYSVDKYGLFPGQLKPPIDLSDYDSEDTAGPTLDGLDSLKDCKT